jgi:hypothetical protein
MLTAENVEALRATIRRWRRQVNFQFQSPDYDQGYHDALGECARELEDILGEQSHFHRCPICESPIQCWCPYPEYQFNDLLAVCPTCRLKVE